MDRKEVGGAGGGWGVRVAQGRSLFDKTRSYGDDGGDGCTAMRMYLLPLNHTLKNDYDDKFYIMCILT